MDLPAFLALLVRKLAIIATLIVATTLAAFVVYLQTPATTTTTLLYSTSVSDTKGLKDSFNTTGIGDDFIHTVAGWTKSPTLAEKVSALAGTSVALSGDAQAAQNLLVTATFRDSKSADKVTSAITQTLREAVSRYNSTSYFQFALTDYGATTTSARPKLTLVLFSAAVGGGVLALFLILIWNYFSGVVTSVASAEALLCASAAVIFSNPKDPTLHLLDALIQKSGKVVLVGADFDPKKIAEKIGTKVATLKLPENSATLVREKFTPLVVVRLDQTKIATLRAVRALLDGEIKLAVWK